MSSSSPVPCDVVLALVPTFVDGEVTDGVAGTVRRHLMDCPACRNAVQEEQTLRQWFVAGPEVEVPKGFAAHVARRAFAGDVGLEPAPTPAAATPEPPPGRVLAFSRALVAVAAGGLVAISLVLAGSGGPEVADLDAGKGLQEALLELEQENERLELEEAPAAPEEGR